MKIHDKYVIELAEVIKGYGNDYQVKEPCNLPCDYKFYEISGVAICEESFKKMKPLEDEMNKLLDKIRAEIWDLQYDDEEKSETDEDRADAYNNGIIQAIEIIDKYKESEE